MKHPPRTEALSVAAALLVELILLVGLATARRMPAGHDTLFYFTLQYVFLNDAVVYGEIPKWLPFAVQGTAANWWFINQAGLLQLVLLQASAVLSKFDFLALFYAGILFDHLVLGVGTWLLARRFMKSRSSTLFVTLSVLGSAVWTSQIWLNFHFITATPLVLHWIHRFLETSKSRYLLLGGNLLALQTLGNVPYGVPILTLVVFLYFLLYGLANFREVGPRMAAACRRPSFLFSLLAVAAGFALIYALASVGTSDTAVYGIQRRPDGSVSLGVFLHYGRNQNPGKWKELFLGLSPVLDHSLYLGTLLPALALLGLPRALGRRNLHFPALALAMACVSTGGRAAAFLYHVWPGMAFYRHLGILTCFTKLFLCFMGGFGFERVWLASPPESRPSRRTLWLLAVLLCFFGWRLLRLSAEADLPARILAMLPVHPGDVWPMEPARGLIALELRKTALFFFLGGLLLIGSGLPRIGRRAAWLPAAALLLHGGDLYSYKAMDSLWKTAALPGSEELLRFQPIPFWKRRAPLESVSTDRTQIFQRGTFAGTLVWFIPTFLFVDEPGSTFRADYWQRPLDRLMKAYWNQPIDQPGLRPTGLSVGVNLLFPLQSASARKAAGVSENKIQFFSKAAVATSQEEVAAGMTAADYTGDFPILLEKAGSSSESFGAPVAQLTPASNTRLTVPCRILRFSSNRLRLQVEVPGPQPIWLFYSGVNHPFWKATVNRRPAPLYTANLAYQAVPLPPGSDTVELRFESPALDLLRAGAAALAGIWTVLVLAVFGILVLGPARLREKL